MQSNNSKLSSYEILAWVFAVFAFAPMIFSFFQAGVNAVQIRDSFFVIVITSVIIGIDSKIQFHKNARFKKRAFIMLALAYASFIAGSMNIFPVFLLPAGLVFLLQSIAILFVQEKFLRLVYAVGFGFYTYLVALIFMPFFDMPMRAFSGIFAKKLLSLINVHADLLLIKNEQLILNAQNSGTFTVAQECNGFGILISCLILSLIFAIFKRSSIIKKMGYVFTSIAIALLANALRICTIVMLFPVVGKPNYHLMHEIVGYTFSLSALILVWSLSGFFAKKKSIES